MMTLELKEKFAALARTDHLQRVHAILSELDVGHGYSQQPEFKQVLARHILQLNELGSARSAYQQTCVLFCLVCGIVEIEDLPHIQSSADLLRHCVQQALSHGVATAVFEHIYLKFAGIANIDEVWLDPKGEPSHLEFSSSSCQHQKQVLIACDQQGPLVLNAESLNELLSISELDFFRCDSGFQHRLAGKFTPFEMLKQVSGSAIPTNNAVVSLQPIVSRCDLGKLLPTHFEPLQQIEVMDARQFHINLTQHEFVFSEQELHQLQMNWQALGFLNDPQILVHQPIISGDLQFQAAWAKENEKFVFKVQGNSRIEIPSVALQWHAALVHEGVLVQFSLQPSQNSRIDWDLTETWEEGQLPVGQPFLRREYEVPVAVNFASINAVGQAVLSAPNGPAGHLLLTLMGCVNANTRHLEMELVLSHSNLRCEWQFASPLLGWSAGAWNLLSQATVARWKLPHG